MSDTVEQLKKELEHYRKLYSTGDNDLAISGYVAYVNLVRQQVEYIKDFKLKDNIEGKKAETVVYERAIVMGENLPDMISKMNRLKAELKIDFDPDGDKPKQGSITPQSIARMNGAKEP